jgi:hypothetical protein
MSPLPRTVDTMVYVCACLARRRTWRHQRPMDFQF